MKFRNKKLILHLLCVLLMIVFIFVVNKLHIPNPMMVLVIPVIYFTYSDGYINGILSGITAIAYSAYFFLVKTNDPAGLAKMLTIILNVATVVILIGKLKNRDKRNMIELLRLNESLVLAATTDNLTGAANRHAFLDTAKTLFDNSVRLKRPISALFIDVDHFKQINDIYSHEFGDVVLARISRIIAKCLRTTDLSCRYGGDEFVVLLSIADDKIAEDVANRMMKEIREARFEQYPDFRLFVSIGISYKTPESEEGLDDLINIADEAMYQAKQSGRNMIIINKSNEAV